MKVKIKCWNGVATWLWVANDENCGICRMAFNGCCPDCKCPPSPVLSELRPAPPALKTLGFPALGRQRQEDLRDSRTARATLRNPVSKN
ncbi:Anaphase-promoting complex subunit 11 [Cricetulus griseus]|uniref:Anaphase-promoting complex subunit 11 n=1 Tax=Cricetulus griseus TaxID=10029 RepID=G3GXB2_CRIGR|nr:Anaphase-promoting complex subunit 11 [Cricetulus griseus]